MGDKTIKFGTVHQWNCYLGNKTLHPLVSVIDLARMKLVQETIQFGFYTILLLEGQCKEFLYGRRYYDYSSGTIVFLSPGQTIEMHPDHLLPLQGCILAFHPDLICGTSLGQNIGKYTFFDYYLNEALHISVHEKQKVLDVSDHIREELLYAIDSHSKTIISRYIELLLDYCSRFYERQFITRCEANQKLMAQLEKMLEAYFETERARTTGLPSAEDCAVPLEISPGYFKDLLKFETGKNVLEYILFKRMEIAKKQLRTTDKPVGQIVADLGYSSLPIFVCQFKKITGFLPDEYRHPN